MSRQDLICRTRSQSVLSEEGNRNWNNHVTFWCRKNTTHNKISPLLQHHLILLLPVVFEVGRKLVPNREERVGRDLFLARLGFDWEGHAQLREAADTERHRCETRLLQHAETYAAVCELAAAGKYAKYDSSSWLRLVLGKRNNKLLKPKHNDEYSFLDTVNIHLQGPPPKRCRLRWQMSSW